MVKQALAYARASAYEFQNPQSEISCIVGPDGSRRGVAFAETPVRIRYDAPIIDFGFRISDFGLRIADLAWLRYEAGFNRDPIAHVRL
jgi:hypothetical protein